VMCFATLLYVRLLVLSPRMTGEGRIGQDFEPSFCHLPNQFFGIRLQESRKSVENLSGLPEPLQRFQSGTFRIKVCISLLSGKQGCRINHLQLFRPVKWLAACLSLSPALSVCLSLTQYCQHIDSHIHCTRRC